MEGRIYNTVGVGESVSDFVTITHNASKVRLLVFFLYCEIDRILNVESEWPCKQAMLYSPNMDVLLLHTGARNDLATTQQLVHATMLLVGT